jgi:hypothetical protein
MSIGLWQKLCSVCLRMAANGSPSRSSESFSSTYGVASSRGTSIPWLCTEAEILPGFVIASVSEGVPFTPAIPKDHKKSIG